MSRANAVPDVGGVDAIVEKHVEGGVCVWEKRACREANIDLDLADALRTSNSVRVLSSCARRCHLSVDIFLTKCNSFIIPVVSGRNSTFLTVPVILSVKVVKRQWPALAVISETGI